MKHINIVAKGVDRSLNRGLLETTIKTLNELVYHGDLFTFYFELGEIFEDLGIGYQKHQLFMLIFEKFKIKCDENILKTILMIDYLKDEKQKPKALFHQAHVKEINKRIIEAGFFTTEEMFRYSRVYRDYRLEDAYIVVIFNNLQEASLMYIVDFKENICRKI